MSGVASPAVSVLYAPDAGKNGYEKSAAQMRHASAIELYWLICVFDGFDLAQWDNCTASHIKARLVFSEFLF